MEEIEIRFRYASNGNIETIVVKDYGLTQAIEQVRVLKNYSGIVLSAKYIDEKALELSLH